MPGPAPKAPGQRRRRNIGPTNDRTVALVPFDPAELPEQIVDIKILPRNDGKPWLDIVEAVWYEVWHSHITKQLTYLDAHTIMPLMYLLQRYYELEAFIYFIDGETGLQAVNTTVVNSQRACAAEIRHWMEEFGLSPRALHTLEWLVAEKEIAEDASARRKRNLGPVLKPGS